MSLEPQERRRYDLDDRGFDEVPTKYRKYYRRLEGPRDVLAPNELLCPVCKVVIRSARELRERLAHVARSIESGACEPCARLLHQLAGDLAEHEGREEGLLASIQKGGNGK